ncbi:MAG: dolichyl-phosphate beta-glucosyltransferase [Vicinamibacterales bacterium]
MPPVFLSIVVPAYNEEGRLGTTLLTLTEYLRDQPWSWEVRVVDDGSTDATVRVADAAASLEPRIVLQREPHRGKGGAVKAGLLAARGQFRFICDADLSMPVSEVVRFLPPLAPPFDVAIGSREGVKARRIGEPAYRHVAGRLFNLGVQWLVLPGVEDSQCGFKMFTADAVESIFPRVSVDGWAFDVEVLAIARARKLRIVELPIEWHYRAESRLNMLRDGWQMLRELLRIRLRAMRGAYGDDAGVGGAGRSARS